MFCADVAKSWQALDLLAGDVILNNLLMLHGQWFRGKQDVPVRNSWLGYLHVWARMMRKGAKCSKANYVKE